MRLPWSTNHTPASQFKHKRYTFMHNGGISQFALIKRTLRSMLPDEVRNDAWLCGYGCNLMPGGGARFVLLRCTT